MKPREKKAPKTRTGAKTKLRELSDELRGGGTERLVEQLRDDLAVLAEGDGRVLVGPFTGEVGFELLYWLPLVRWAVREFPTLNGRLVVVSRGGVAQWWSSFLDVEYVDILSLYEPNDYVTRKGRDKQRDPKGFDDEIVGRVQAKLGTDFESILHPSLLFNFYRRARKGHSDVFAQNVTSRDGGADGLAAVYDPIPHPTVRPELDALLPDDFVAMRFYFRESFPRSDENRRFAEETVARLAAVRPVVLLNNRLELDEHSDIEARADGVITIDQLMQADDNLSVQTEVLSRAAGFVGTYGGLAYLAPFLGVPSIGFSSDPVHAAPWHRSLAMRLFAAPPWGNLITLRSEDLGVLDRLLARS